MLDRKTLYWSLLKNPQQTYKLGHYRRTVTCMVRVFSEDAGRALEKGERGFGRVVDRGGGWGRRPSWDWVFMRFVLNLIYLTIMQKTYRLLPFLYNEMNKKVLPVSSTVYLPSWSVLFLLELAVAYRLIRCNLDHKPKWLIVYLFIEAQLGPSIRPFFTFKLSLSGRRYELFVCISVWMLYGASWTH